MTDKQLEIFREMKERFKKKKPMDDLFTKLKNARRKEKTYTPEQTELCVRIFRGKRWLETNEGDKQYGTSLDLYTKLVDEAYDKYLIAEEEAWEVGKENPVVNVFGDVVEEVIKK